MKGKFWFQWCFIPRSFCKYNRILWNEWPGIETDGLQRVQNGSRWDMLLVVFVQFPAKYVFFLCISQSLILSVVPRSLVFFFFQNVHQITFLPPVRPFAFFRFVCFVLLPCLGFCFPGDIVCWSVCSVNGHSDLIAWCSHRTEKIEKQRCFTHRWCCLTQVCGCMVQKKRVLGSVFVLLISLRLFVSCLVVFVFPVGRELSFQHHLGLCRTADSRCCSSGRIKTPVVPFLLEREPLPVMLFAWKTNIVGSNEVSFPTDNLLQLRNLYILAEFQTHFFAACTICNFWRYLIIWNSSTVIWYMWLLALSLKFWIYFPSKNQWTTIHSFFTQIPQGFIAIAHKIISIVEICFLFRKSWNIIDMACAPSEEVQNLKERNCLHFAPVKFGMMSTLSAQNTFGNLECFLEVRVIQVIVCIYLSRLMEGWIGNWNQLSWKTMPQNRRFEQLLDTNSWFAHNRTPFGTFSWDVAQNHTTRPVCRVPLRHHKHPFLPFLYVPTNRWKGQKQS